MSSTVSTSKFDLFYIIIVLGTSYLDQSQNIPQVPPTVGIVKSWTRGQNIHQVPPTVGIVNAWLKSWTQNQNIPHIPPTVGTMKV